MSLYKRAMVYGTLSTVGFLIVGPGSFMIYNAYGIWAAFAVALSYLLPEAIVLLYYFKCPTCGTSIFCPSGTRSLWNTEKVSYYPRQTTPAKSCAKCGRDHSLYETA